MMASIIVLLSALLIFSCRAGKVNNEVKHNPDLKQVPSDQVPFETAPEKLTDPKPIYPKLALMNGYEAVVWVSSTIDSVGHVTDVSIMKFNGEENVGFEESAMEAAWATKWKPASQDGKTVGTIIAYRIIFSLQKK
ncbi:MAG: energy transducer TonB [candidate division Zixibacteria bacterium]|nr:energy transducer TonB [candidate division Zixibacteria bacterium]